MWDTTNKWGAGLAASEAKKPSEKIEIKPIKMKERAPRQMTVDIPRDPVELERDDLLPVGATPFRTEMATGMRVIISDYVALEPRTTGNLAGRGVCVMAPSGYMPHLVLDNQNSFVMIFRKA